MKLKFFGLPFILIFMMASCSYDDNGASSPGDSFPEGESSGGQSQPGVMTAGEWNDLNNWSFWLGLMQSNNYATMPNYWSFYNNNRISVQVFSDNEIPVVNASVELKSNNVVVFKARTDNKGKAELWADLLQNNPNSDFSNLIIDVNQGAVIVSDVKPYNEGVNTVLTSLNDVNNLIEISFVVDATGSMGDELEFLKTELLDVISRIEAANPLASVYTSSVFYRDEGDEYVTKIAPFTNDMSATINFIKQQNAAGGGDFPEAVHTALDKAINELQWSVNAKTRILFLVLDAPPHYNSFVVKDLQSSILKAAEKGIKIVPITASGIDKKTEFLMRFFSISTNGTYVFITDDSGIGNSHLEPSVGQYEVEYLNNLMVRLINQYAE